MRLSHHDFLCVELLKIYAKKWNKSGDTLFVSSAFDYRRVHPKLGPLFFGNAILATFTEIKFDELYNNNTLFVAQKIRAATASVNEEKVLDSLKYIEAYREKMGLKELEKLHVAHPQNGYLITNLSRAKLNHFDFGQGAPTDILPLVPGPRSLAVLDGGTDYLIRVSP